MPPLQVEHTILILLARSTFSLPRSAATVTAQREIEKAVRQALAEHKLKGNELAPTRFKSLFRD